MPYFRAVAFVLAMAFFVMLVAPVQALARWRDWRLQHAIQKFFCGTMCRVIGVEVIPSGRLPGAAPRFVVANHVSWTDILAIASLYPLVFLAKSEVAKWPVLGFLARLQGTIFVDRGRRQAIPRSMRNWRKCCVRDKTSLFSLRERPATGAECSSSTRRISRC